MSVKGNYSSNSFNSYDPMLDDYNSTTFNSYDRGPGRNLPLDHHPAHKMTSKAKPSMQLYVTGIPATLTNEGLKNIFSEYGTVLRSFCCDSKRDLAGDKKYGFVDFTSIKEATEALHAVNNQEPFYLHVDFAFSKDDKKRKENAMEMEQNHLQQQFQNRLSAIPRTPEKLDLGSMPNINIRVTGNQKTISCTSNNNDKSRPNSVMSDIGSAKGSTGKYLVEHFTACGPSQQPLNRSTNVKNGFEQHSFDVGVVERKILTSPDEYKSKMTSHQPIQLPCTFCQQPGGFRCQRCKAWYCGQTCQLNDWPNHKKDCQVKPTNGNFPAPRARERMSSFSSEVEYNNKPRPEKPDNPRIQDGHPNRPFLCTPNIEKCQEMPITFNNQKKPDSGRFTNDDKKFRKPIVPRPLSSASVASMKQAGAPVSFPKALTKPVTRSETTENGSSIPNSISDSEQKPERKHGCGPLLEKLRRPFDKPDVLVQSAEKPSEKLDIVIQSAESPLLSLSLAVVPCNVRVVFVVNPNEFYVQKVANSEEVISKELCELSLVLQQQAVADKPLAVPLGVGDYCLALFSVDLIWYRAKVLKVLENKTHEVFFVDYGNKECIEITNLRPLPEKLRVMPGQALSCILGKVAPLDKDWEADAVQGFNMLTDGVVLQCHLLGFQGEAAVVGLRDDEGNDVSDLMVQLKQAQISALPEEQSIVDKIDQISLRSEQELVPGKSNNIKSPPSTKQGENSSASLSVNNSAVGVFPLIPSVLSSLSAKDNCLVATVTWIVDQTHFWASIIDEATAQKIAILSQTLTLRHEVKSVGFTTSVGEVVSARSSDGISYRAYVKNKLSDNSYQVLFMDFGNEETVSSMSSLLPDEKSIVCPTIQFTSEGPLELSLEQTLLLKMASISPDSVIFCLVDNEGNKKAQLVGQPWFHEFFNEASSLLPPQVASFPSPQKPEGSFRPSPQKPILASVPSPPKPVVASLPSPLKPVVASLPSPPKPVVMFQDMKKRVTSKSFQAVVVWIKSPDEVYLQLTEDADTLTTLMAKIAEFVSRGQKAVLLKANQLVLAPEDGIWYRAKVESISEQVAQVRFIDYGNSCELTVADIVPCPMELTVDPPFAILASLEGVSDLTLEEQTSLVEGVWKVEVSSCNKDVVSVRLFGPKGQFKPAAKSQPISSPILKATTSKVVLPSPAKTPNPETSPKANGKDEFYKETFSNQPYVDIPIGEKTAVTITSVSSPDIIYVNYFPGGTETSKFLNLCGEIKEYCENCQPIVGYEPPLANFCLALFDEDGCWYRAVVLGEKTAGNFKVLFVDYGNIANTGQVMPIPSRFMDLPLQAAHCRLDGILEQDIWPETVCEELQSILMANTDIEVTMTGVDSEGVYCVNIPSARDYMLQKKLLVPDPKPVIPSVTPVTVTEQAAVAAPAPDLSEMEAMKKQIKELQELLAAMSPK